MLGFAYGEGRLCCWSDSSQFDSRKLVGGERLENKCTVCRSVSAAKGIRQSGGKFFGRFREEMQKHVQFLV